MRWWLLPAILLVACGGEDEVSSGDDVGGDEASADSASEASAVDAPSEDVAIDDVSIDSPGTETGAACGCGSFLAPVTAGTVPGVLTETSGLAASRVNPGVLYAHNDSGDTARIFALDEKGALLGQINFGGASASDWEDMAVGPCGTTTCVFVGDVGDNAESRSNYAVYSIEEPVLDGKPFANRTIAAKKFPFTYPDGKHNCETVLVHPTTGEVYLVTKRASEDGGLYRFPKLEAGTSVTLERVGAAKGTSGSLVTGGDISPCGDRVLLRTYGALLQYTITSGETLAAAFAKGHTSVPVAKEGQGEAVAFRHDGRGYFTAPEGSMVALSVYGCK